MNLGIRDKRLLGGLITLALILGISAAATSTVLAQVNDDRRQRDRRQDDRDVNRGERRGQERERESTRAGENARERERRERDRERIIRERERDRLARERERERERERIAREREIARERSRRPVGPIYRPGRVYDPVYGSNRYPDNSGRYGSARAIAEQRGYATGLDRGRDDARDHRSYNPNNSSHYRDGDSGYHSEYGSKDAYRAAYRDGFRRGYAAGYREFSGYHRR